MRAIKIGADGALGSRGAALLEPYSDEPGTNGLMTTPPDEIYAHDARRGESRLPDLHPRHRRSRATA